MPLSEYNDKLSTESPIPPRSTYTTDAYVFDTCHACVFEHIIMLWLCPRWNVTVVKTKGYLKQPTLYYANSSSSYHPYRLVTLSNYVQENPGPVSNPCASCDRPVAKNHRFVQCVACNKPCHGSPHLTIKMFPTGHVLAAYYMNYHVTLMKNYRKSNLDIMTHFLSPQT